MIAYKREQVDRKPEKNPKKNIIKKRKLASNVIAQCAKERWVRKAKQMAIVLGCEG